MRIQSECNRLERVAAQEKGAAKRPARIDTAPYWDQSSRVLSS
jgi:hypothetical protein